MSQVTQERAAFATWLAGQHLRFDARLSEAVFLPADAPDDEVRLLEVNTGLFPDPDNSIVPVETTPAISDLPFRVVIADVSPAEWTRIQGNPTLLPAGWSLSGSQRMRRTK